MLTFCQRFVLMLECETFCALSFRLPVMSLLAMTARATWRNPNGMSSASPELARFSGFCRPEGPGERPAPVLHTLESGRLGEGGLLHVKAPRELDLDDVDLEIGAPVVLRRVSALVGVVVCDGQPCGPS